LSNAAQRGAFTLTLITEKEKLTLTLLMILFKIAMTLLIQNEVLAVDFYRNAEKYLEKWRISPYRKPLVLRGARQTGKTTLIKKYGGQMKFEVPVCKSKFQLPGICKRKR
jgi:hypothetical protein